MGLAVDTVGVYATNAGATGKAVTVSSGDSLTIRAFNPPATALLVAMFRQDTTEGFLQLKSPRLANDTTGIKIRTAESPAKEMYPPYGLQSMYSTDTLTVNISGKTAATTGGHNNGGYQIYYSTLQGLSARLHTWAEIANNIRNVFTQTVAVETGANGTWVTVLSNVTKDLMKADTTYALVGYNVSTAYSMVGLKAQETGTLRICGSGTEDSLETSWYYVRKSEKLGLPFIPVVNSNNRGNVHVTAQANAATTTGHVSLTWLELNSSVG